MRNRVKPLLSAAEYSVGSKEALEAAQIQLSILLNSMDEYVSGLKALLQDIEERDSLC